LPGLRYRANRLWDHQSPNPGTKRHGWDYVVIQMKFTLSTVIHTRCAPATIDLLTSGIEGSISQLILHLTARLASYNPPEIKSDVAWVNSTLELAGIVNSTYTKQEGDNITTAAVMAKTFVLDVPHQPWGSPSLFQRPDRLLSQCFGRLLEPLRRSRFHCLCRIFTTHDGPGRIPELR
jgi:hypothetical protein